MLKAKIVPEALWYEATAAKLAAKYQLSPNQIYVWKKRLLEIQKHACLSTNG